MANGAFGTVTRQVDRLFGEGTVAGLGETQLLERFLNRRDDAAFQAIVERHGPMVLGVCRRVLRDRHDAEDAFQATFLLLARKAGTIRGTGLVGPWLYRVAHRVAVRASLGSARRRGREHPDTQATSEAPAPDGSPADRDLPLAIHEELARLPEKYRVPVTLCYLEGLTHEEAAARLRWPVGTVKGRLSRARDRLRDRLAVRGLAAPISLLAASLARDARAAVPPSLVDSTVQAATSVAAGKAAAGLASAAAVSLAEGVANAMFLKKLKTAALAALLAASLVGAGLGAITRDGPEAPGQRTPTGPVDPRTDAVPEAERAEIQGLWKIAVVEQDGRVIHSAPESGPWSDLIIWADGHFSLELIVPPAEIPILGRGAYILDAGRSPQAIDLSGDGAESGVTQRGIYRLDADRQNLLICLAARGAGDRPSEFATRPGSGLTLLRLESEARAIEAPDALGEGVASAKAPEHEIAGNWKIVRNLKSGVSIASALPTEDTILIRLDGQIQNARGGIWLPYRLDPTRSPKSIDLLDPLTDGGGIAHHGIYRRDGDNLILCLSPGSSSRPTSFVSPPGSDIQLLDLRLVGPPPAIATGAPAQATGIDSEPSPPSPPVAQAPGSGPAEKVAIPQPTPGITEERRHQLSHELEQMRDEEGLLEDDLADARERLRDLKRRSLDIEEKLMEADRSEPEGKKLMMRHEFLKKMTAEARFDFEKGRAQLQEYRDRAAQLRREMEAPSVESPKVKPGDVLIVEVLEGLPGRPITGERMVRSDGTLGLGFYGEIPVAGLDLKQIKVKVIEHLRKYLTEDVLGLTGQDRHGRQVSIPAVESDRVFVEEALPPSPGRMGAGRLDELERQLERALSELKTLRRRQEASPRP